MRFGAIICLLTLLPAVASADEPPFDPAGLPSDPAGWSFARWRAEPDRFPGTLEVIAGKYAVHVPGYEAAATRELIARVPDAEGDAARAELFLAALIASERAGNPFGNEEAAAASLGEAGAAAVRFRDGLRAWAASDVDAAAADLAAFVSALPPASFDRHDALAAVAHDTAAAGTLPLRRPGEPGFAARVAERRVSGEADLEELLFGLSEAIVTFDGRSILAPALYECLGDVLSVRPRQAGEPDGLAERAYLRAAMLVDDGDAAAGYEALAAEAVAETAAAPLGETEIGREVTEIRDQLALEVAESTRWAEELRESEEAWIAAGLDPLEEFRTRYGSQILRVPRSRLRHRYTTQGIPPALIAGTIGLTVLTVAGLFVIVGRKRRSSEA